MMRLSSIRYRWSLLCVSFLVMCLLWLTMPVQAADAVLLSQDNRQTIRVGFYQMDGYHMMSDNGRLYGYGYDYLQLMRRFTDWKYEYVGYDKGWQEMFDMLDAGEIDLLTAVQKTPDRELKYVFSAAPMSTSSLLFTTLLDNDKYVPSDVSTYNGMRVGLLAGNKRTEEFAVFAAEQGFAYTPVYYASAAAEKAALENGEVDGIVTSSKRDTDGEKILELRNPQDLFCMTRPDKGWIIEEINKAQQKLNHTEPGWEASLTDRYYSDVVGRLMSLSPSGRSFLQELRHSDRVFKVALMPHAKPYAWFDSDGLPHGILPDIFKITAKNMGIKYEIVPVKTQAEYQQMIDSADIDIILGMSANFYEAEKIDYDLTHPILRASMVQVFMNEEDRKKGLIGVTSNVRRKLGMTSGLPANISPQVLDTPEQAVTALKGGHCGSVYMLSLSGQNCVYNDTSNRLRMAIVPGLPVDFRLGISGRLDHRFFEVISAATPTLGDVEVQEIINRYSELQPRPMTIEGLFYSHPIQFMIMAFFMLLLLGMMVITSIRNHAASQEEQRRRDIDAVMSYVCRLNETVVKVDLDSLTATEYHIDSEGNLSVDVIPHNVERYTHYLHPDDYAKFQPGGEYEQEMQTAFAEKRSYYCEVRKRDDSKDDGFCYYACQFQPILVNNRVDGFYFYRQDIDEMRRKELDQRKTLSDALENARHASAAKGDFLSRISHEIRTPLNAIIGYLTIGGQADNTEDRLRYAIEKSEIAAQHLLALINDVLDLSSIEQGKLQLAYEEFSLDEMLTEIRTIFNGQVEKKKITMLMDTEQLKHDNMIGDVLRIKQVLMNIVSNAVKFTPEGGRIDIVVKQVMRPNNVFFTNFEITDTGVGMSSEYLDKIFKPFVQENAQVAKKYGGSGLGMAITQNLVKMMQGSIEVRSVLGKGSSFYVSIPLRGVETPVEDGEASAGEEHSFEGVRLLLVEDNEMNREISETILSQHGFAIDTAEDGQVAVDKFTAAPAGTYQAILMDVQMPVLDGYGATQAIRRSTHPEAGSIPIIAVTADVFTDDVARVMACGMNDYLSKPIDFNKLIIKLKKYI